MPSWKTLMNILPSVTGKAKSSKANPVADRFDFMDDVEDFESGELDFDDIDDFNEQDFYEEVDLDNKSALQVYIEETKHFKLLSNEEELELANAKVLGDASARDKLIEHNLRLVINIAKKYRRSGIPLDELIAVGNTGLIQAVEKFDLDKGCKLSTYATIWIKQRLNRYLIEQNKNIRLPEHLHKRVRDYINAVNELTHKLGILPSLSELATEMNTDEKEIIELAGLVYSESSLDTQINDRESESFTLADIIPDSNIISPDKQLSNKQQNAQLMSVIPELAPYEQEIVKLRFGIESDEDELSYDAIAQKYNMSRSMVRNIEQKALLKLRDILKKRL